MLFEAYMTIVAIVLLNLLIVIMNDATEQVRSASQMHAISNRAQLVIEIDELWVPVLLGLGQRRLADAKNFPRWLHVLAPARSELALKKAD